MRAFSSRVLRCLGASTKVASIICSARATQPWRASYWWKRSNRAFSRFSVRIFSRNSQTVLASGTLCSSCRPRKRMKDSRSRIWYSIVSSERLCSYCGTRILNISTSSLGLEPAWLLSVLSCMRKRSERKASQSISTLSATRGSPISVSLVVRVCRLKNSGWL